MNKVIKADTLVYSEWVPVCGCGRKMEPDLWWNSPEGWRVFWCEVCDLYTIITNE